ncbi:MAG: hypothetical protein IPP66_05695 [Anaerolineales bacterium]|nr:hypothetical protein [Anaerolineales bacterium]
MFKRNPIFISVMILIVASLACSSSGLVATPDPNFINTSVAQTFVALQTQNTQPGIPVTGVDTLVPTLTFTPEPPTVTPTATLSPTVTLTPTPIFTDTPSVPQISVSVPTNCRVGPGKAYDRVGALLVGEVAQIYGRDLAGNYWYIRNPDNSGDFCWLWGEYAMFGGNISALPIFTPPPTPTPVPAFELSYDGLEACNNAWWVEVKLKNIGGTAFRSISMSVKDKDTNITVSMTDDSFKNTNGCNSSDSRKMLDIGDTIVVSAPSYAYDPTGHKLQATVTLCSEDGVNGLCMTETTSFTP